MPKRHPKRDEVERILQEQPKRKAFNIAQETGLDTEMGTEKATDYIRSVRKSMRKKGKLARFNPDDFAPDDERLEDITTLFEIRRGRMSKRAAQTMLLMNCYLRLRSDDNDVHMDAIWDTYRKNDELINPFPINEAISICGVALARYMVSNDAEENREAMRKGYPGAGLNYTNKSLRLACEITEEELPHLKTIG